MTAATEKKNVTYENEWNTYVDNVMRLWAEVQNAPTAGLSAQQLQQLKAFQAENNTFKETIDQNHTDMLLAYYAADAAGKGTMEDQLRQLKKSLQYAEQVFRTTQAARQQQ
jgi:hypothetical protein